MKSLFYDIQPTTKEVAMALAGDDIIPMPDAVMDRAFTVKATPEVVWPWFAQLGKHRAGWYFPHSVERFIPHKRRALWTIDSSFQGLKVGDIIDDWGGKHGYLEVAIIEAPTTLVYKSTRGKLSMSWAITLWPDGSSTRILIRLRIRSGGKKLFFALGELFDKLTIQGMARGLQQRIASKD